MHFEIWLGSILLGQILLQRRWRRISWMMRVGNWRGKANELVSGGETRQVLEHYCNTAKFVCLITRKTKEILHELMAVSNWILRGNTNSSSPFSFLFFFLLLVNSLPNFEGASLHPVGWPPRQTPLVGNHSSTDTFVAHVPLKIQGGKEKWGTNCCFSWPEGSWSRRRPTTSMVG